ncbi:hypothetical protein VPNG_04893 [Cytospora leucostoma]|uniref:Uncharacterized protein n=1 Tax=Cytospora leucostoma TaxID=1230097 RepID=A0A423XB46_9PEZI|nr:hypothetical protein VPNG_04893 [Cytospora leucostoma]
MDSFRKNSTSNNDSSFSRDNNSHTGEMAQDYNNSFRSAGRRSTRRSNRSNTADSSGLGDNFFLAQLPGRDRSGSSASQSTYNSFLHDDDKSATSRSSSQARPSDNPGAPELSQSQRMILQEIGAALTLHPEGI